MFFKGLSGQARVKKMLFGAISGQRIASAYLFVCQDVSLASDFAAAFAAALNCEGGETDACGQCLSCRKVSKGVHPDIIFISPDGETIKIDQVRDLRALTRYGPSEGKWKTVIVLDADKIKDEAANSFLKSLEEPPDRVVFILIVSSAEGLPKTVLSRCQKVIFSDDGLPRAVEQRSKELATQALKAPSVMTIDGLLELSQGLSKEKAKLPEILSGMLGLLRADMVNGKNRSASGSIKAVLEAFKSIKKNANKRLAIDNMLLKLKGIGYAEKTGDKA